MVTITQKGSLIRIEYQWPGDWVRCFGPDKFFFRPCLDLEPGTHEDEGSTLPLCYSDITG